VVVHSLAWNVCACATFYVVMTSMLLILRSLFIHTVNSNYFAIGVAKPPTSHQLDRAAMHIFASIK